MPMWGSLVMLLRADEGKFLVFAPAVLMSVIGTEKAHYLGRLQGGNRSNGQILQP